MTHSRKRLRSTDDCEDCVPISKRINSLHIRPSLTDEDRETCIEGYINNNDLKCHNHENATRWQQCTGNHFHSTSPSFSQSSCQHQQHNPVHNGSPNLSNAQCYSNQSPSSMSGAVSDSIPPGYGNESFTDCPQDEITESMQYEPELDINDNPHYFHINEVLFNAHAARTLRLRNEFSPGT